MKLPEDSTGTDTTPNETLVIDLSLSSVQTSIDQLSHFVSSDSSIWADDYELCSILSGTTSLSEGLPFHPCKDNKQTRECSSKLHLIELN